VTRTITARPATVDIGGRTVSTWTLDGTVPGPELRVHPDDRLRLTLRNQLPVATSLHWHGLDLRNDMDGAPGAAGSAIPPGGSAAHRADASARVAVAAGQRGQAAGGPITLASHERAAAGQGLGWSLSV
jgi:FtsP/CotA-like multicopper oxidase with cupredoxin domain